VKKKIVQDK